MAKKDIIMMSNKELNKLYIIHYVLDKKLSQIGAAKLLNLSDRQIRRIVKRVKKEGDIGIIHKSRSKLSNRAISKDIKGKVIKLYKDKYKGFGPTLATEKLFEIDKIKISDETLRSWLIKQGEWKIKHRRKKHRQWRERKKYFGEMVQMDGSHHDWLEKRGPNLVLMGYIDDATNTAFAHFYDYEGTFPAMDSFRRYIEHYNIPKSVYLDKHTTYKSTRKLTIEEELQGVIKPKSQFERALDELGVKIIHANSPQAKGRIERLFNTFQDRLIKEMRLANVSSKEKANSFLKDYLPVYNKRFNIAPAKEANLHREIPEEIDLESIFSIKTKRVLRNDNTILYKGQLYQIIDIPLNRIVKAVIIEERIDGKICITYNNLKLKYKKIQKIPLKAKELPKPRKIYIPPKDHPWRNYRISYNR